MICTTRFAAQIPVLPSLQFSRKFGLVFVWSCVFVKTCVFLVLGLVLIEIFLVLGLSFADFCFADCIFFKFYGTFAVSIVCYKHIGRVFVKSCLVWLVFSDFLLYVFN